jgi:hypothetical protein
MNLMQYAIALPADYDMRIIRDRVATKGPLLDDFAGLGLKAYCIRERGTDGAPGNEYAPFYLWHSTQGMNRFLWGGGGFGGILESFGRPVVAHWLGLAVEHGPARGSVPRAASRSIEPVPIDADPAAVVQGALEALGAQASAPGVHSAALGIDPRRWEVVRFTLWEDAAPAMAGVRYQVLHLSTPELGALQSAANAW